WETFRMHGSLAGHRAAYVGADGGFFQPRHLRPVAEPAAGWWHYAGPFAVVFTGLAGGAVESADPRSPPGPPEPLAQDRSGSTARPDRGRWLALRGAPDGAERA